MIPLIAKDVKAFAFKITRISEFKQATLLKEISLKLGFSCFSALKTTTERENKELNPDNIISIINFVSSEGDIPLQNVRKLWLSVWPDSKSIFNEPREAKLIQGKNSITFEELQEIIESIDNVNKRDFWTVAFQAQISKNLEIQNNLDLAISNIINSPQKCKQDEGIKYLAKQLQKQLEYLNLKDIILKNTLTSPKIIFKESESKVINSLPENFCNSHFIATNLHSFDKLIDYISRNWGNWDNSHFISCRAQDFKEKLQSLPKPALFVCTELESGIEKSLITLLSLLIDNTDQDGNIYSGCQFIVIADLGVPDVPLDIVGVNGVIRSLTYEFGIKPEFLAKFSTLSIYNELGLYED